jgi:hypothetical protein
VFNLFYNQEFDEFEGFDCFNQGFYQQEPDDEPYDHFSQSGDEVFQCLKGIVSESKRAAKAVYDCIEDLQEDDKEILLQMGYFIVIFIFKLGLFVVLKKGYQHGFLGDL